MLSHASPASAPTTAHPGLSRRSLLTLSAAAAVLTPAFAAGPASATAAAPAGSAGPESSAAGSAAELVAQMTLDEKIALVHGTGFGFTVDYAGSVAANARLGIPALVLGDGAGGVGNGATGVTQWPAPINLASTWDPDLAEAYGVAAGAEHFGKGRTVVLGPTINILRRPNWGRAFETYTEDPYLNGQLAAAMIRGTQSNHVITTVKHFAANNQEIDRGTINEVIAVRALQEIYLPGFRAAVRAGGSGAVMGAYDSVNGAFCCQNSYLLTDVLRGEFGFTGFVVSDWFAEHSTVDSAEAGLAMEMPDDSYFGAALEAAVQNGQVAESTLDAMVTGILTPMLALGLFDHPAPDPASVTDIVVTGAANLAFAQRLSEQGTVLLRNERDLLPLDSRRPRSIAVIGDAANATPKTVGGGSATVTAYGTVPSPLAAITARAGAQVEVSFAQGTLGTGALTSIASSALTPATGSGNGLTGTYYATADFSGTPLGTELDPQLDFTAAPAIVGTASTWSAVWTGTLTAPATGDYRFSVTGQGDTVLTIDGTTVVDYTTGYETVFNGLIHLTAGAHAIKADYVPGPPTFGPFGAATMLQVGWQVQEDLLVKAAAETAGKADVAIVFVNDDTSEGMDRSTLALPADQDKLIEAVAAANPNTIVVLNTSAAVLMPWIDRVAGVYAAWYGGQNAAPAIAALLFGDANPSGRLTHTFPATDAQGPAKTALEYPGNGTDVYYDEGIYVGYRWYDHSGEKPLFPFGFGLSYTTFGYSDLRVDPVGQNGSGGYQVSVTVANTGRREGAEVVQLYLESPAAAQEAPKQLKAFMKLSLAPGQRERVTLRLEPEAFQAWLPSVGDWSTVPGRYTLAVGGSSHDLPLRTQLDLR